MLVNKSVSVVGIPGGETGKTSACSIDYQNVHNRGMILGPPLSVKGDRNVGS
jgi:hypothetical protein